MPSDSMVRPRIRAKAPGTTLSGTPRNRTEWTSSRSSSSGRPSAPTRTTPRAPVRSNISLTEARYSSPPASEVHLTGQERRRRARAPSSGATASGFRHPRAEESESVRSRGGRSYLWRARRGA